MNRQGAKDAKWGPWRPWRLGGLFLLRDAHAPPLTVKAAFGEQPNRLGVGFALLLEDAGRKAVGRVVVEDRHGALQDDGAVVVDVVGEMDGAAADLDPHFDGGLV